MVRFHSIVVRSALAVVMLTSLGGFACAGTDHTGPGSAMTSFALPRPDRSLNSSDLILQSHSMILLVLSSSS